MSRRARSDPGTSPARTAAITPARSTEDLPLPEAPTTASSLPGRQPADQLGDDALAAEEELAVLGLEGEQATVGALGPGQRRRHARALERVDALRHRHARQAVRAEIDQRAPRRQMAGDEVRRDRGEEDLAAVGLRAQARREVDRRAEIVGAAALGLAGVQAEAGA